MADSSDSISNKPEAISNKPEITGQITQPQEEQAEVITIKLCDQGKQQLFYRIRKNAELKKVFKAYADRIGVPLSTLTFTLDGEKLRENETAESRNLTEDDQIDVFYEQVGGSDSEEKPHDGIITVQLLDPDGQRIGFKIRKTTEFSKVFEAYANRNGQQLDRLRFLYNGKRVHQNATPKMMEMDDSDEIQVMVDQQGGYSPR